MPGISPLSISDSTCGILPDIVPINEDRDEYPDRRSISISRDESKSSISFFSRALEREFVIDSS